MGNSPAWCFNCKLTSSLMACTCRALAPVQITKKSAKEVMPVRSRTLISVAFLDSAARTAMSQEGSAVWVSWVSLRSTLVRTCSCPYRTTPGGACFRLPGELGFPKPNTGKNTHVTFEIDMPRPICFMIMPYSTKTTSAAQGSGAPDKVNFDRLWEAALRPAIDKAGYEPVRANEDIGALIINEMIERLAISDLVLADVSIPNGNVYYEVGIRHAAQKQGCIMTAATWAKPLFDIDQMRQIRYPLPTESISDETAAEIIKIVEAAIPIMAAGDSPFYQVFPKYPEFDPARVTAFKKTVEELSKFQADIIAARSASGEQRRTRALELRDRLH